MTINEYGTEEQKQKYIPDLVSGTKVGSFCDHRSELGF